MSEMGPEINQKTSKKHPKIDPKNRSKKGRKKVPEKEMEMKKSRPRARASTGLYQDITKKYCKWIKRRKGEVQR